MSGGQVQYLSRLHDASIVHVPVRVEVEAAVDWDVRVIPFEEATIPRERPITVHQVCIPGVLDIAIPSQAQLGSAIVYLSTVGLVNKLTKHPLLASLGGVALIEVYRCPGGIQGLSPSPVVVIAALPLYV